jgi:hypothetical protein
MRNSRASHGLFLRIIAYVIHYDDHFDIRHGFEKSRKLNILF